MKTLKKLPLVILISIFVFAAPLANAQKKGQGNKSNSNKIDCVITDLSDKQKEDINTLRTAHIKEAQQIKNQMDIKRSELKALQQVDSPNMDAINKKIDERAALRTDLEKKTAAHRQSVRNTLTDDQRIIFDQNVKKGHHNKGNASNCGSNKGQNCRKSQKKNCGQKNGKSCSKSKKNNCGSKK